MEKAPLSWAETGVWFLDWGRALEMAGAPRPRTMEEFGALTQEQREQYSQATYGIAPGPNAREQMREYPAESEEDMGLSVWRMDLGIGPGTTSSEPVQPAYMEGEFDGTTVRRKLLDLGYEEREAAGRTYYAVHEDYAGDFGAPTSLLRFNSYNRLYVDDSTLITAPATEMLEGVLGTWAGEEPSALTNAAFVGIGEALWDALSVAILPRSVALDVSMIAEGQQPQFKKQETWGTLHEWESVGFGFGRDADGSEWAAISLYYSDPDAAGDDAGELVHRLETYETSVWPELVERGWPEHPLQDIEVLGASRDGQVLTVKYQKPEPGPEWPVGRDPQTAQYVGPRFWFQLVDMRDLGFLVP